jgi:hypothetical protein
VDKRAFWFNAQEPSVNGLLESMLNGYADFSGVLAVSVPCMTLTVGHIKRTILRRGSD